MNSNFIIIQYKPTKCTFYKLIFQFLILMFSTCFALEGSSSGRWLYMQLRIQYGTHISTRLLIPLHVKRTVP